MRNLFNTLMFPVRNSLAWHRPGFVEHAEDKRQWLMASDTPLDVIALEARLCETYALHDFKARSTLLRYQEALSILAQLEALAPDGLDLPSQDTPAQWLDVGSKNWAYVDTLVAFGKKNHPNLSFLGVELDGYGIYPDGHSRADYAQAYAAPYPQAVYHVADVLSISGQFQVVSCFLPFVFEAPHLAWGLPLSKFDPQGFCTHLLSLVAPGGHVLITNQGPTEFEAQQALLDGAFAEGDFTTHWQGPLPNTTYPYRYPRFGWHLRKACSASPQS